MTSPQDPVAELRAKAEKATPHSFGISVTRYIHGSGRLSTAEDSPSPRDLIADFYDEANREFYFACDPAVIIALIDRLGAAEAERDQASMEHGDLEILLHESRQAKEAAEKRAAELERALKNAVFLADKFVPRGAYAPALEQLHITLAAIPPAAPEKT